MGKENKDNGGHNASEGKKEEQTVEEMTILKVDMHCDACAKKVVKALRGCPGVEDIALNRTTNMVMVKGPTADPKMLCERILKKSGRKVELISPLPKLPDKQPKDQHDQVKQEQPPPVTSVVLQVQMHCEACAQQLRKRIQKVKGIESVQTDVAKGRAIVKGVIEDPASLANYVYKSTRKQVSIVKDEEKKEEQGKKEGKKEANKANTGGEGEQGDNHKVMSEINRYEYYWPPRFNYMETADSYNLNHHPQIFSDENPNACFIM